MQTQSNVPTAPIVPSSHYRPTGSKQYDPFGPYRREPPKPVNRESGIEDIPSRRRYTQEEYVLLFRRFS